MGSTSRSSEERTRPSLPAAALEAEASALPTLTVPAVTTRQVPGEAVSTARATPAAQVSARSQAAPAAPPQPTLGEAGPQKTFSAILEELRSENPMCVFLAWRISRLGFDSHMLLQQHFRRYGQVKQVMVAHSKMKAVRSSLPRTRPGNLGFIIMQNAEDVQRVLAEGSEQLVGGLSVIVQAFDQTEMDQEGACSSRGKSTSGSSGCVKESASSGFNVEAGNVEDEQLRPEEGAGSCDLKGSVAEASPSQPRSMHAEVPRESAGTAKAAMATSSPKASTPSEASAVAPPVALTPSSGSQLFPAELASQLSDDQTRQAVALSHLAEKARQAQQALQYLEAQCTQSLLQFDRGSHGTYSEHVPQLPSTPPMPSLPPVPPSALPPAWTEEGSPGHHLLGALQEMAQLLSTLTGPLVATPLGLPFPAVPSAAGFTTGMGPRHPMAASGLSMPVAPPGAQPPTESMPPPVVPATVPVGATSVAGSSIRPPIWSGRSRAEGGGRPHAAAKPANGASSSSSFSNPQRCSLRGSLAGGGDGPRGSMWFGGVGPMPDPGVLTEWRPEEKTPLREETLAAHLAQLQDEDPAKILVARSLTRLGPRSQTLLWQHCSQYGEVASVHFTHSKEAAHQDKGMPVPRRKRPCSMGLIVMKNAMAVDEVLASGKRQRLAGQEIHIKRFQRPAGQHGGLAGEDTAKAVPDPGVVSRGTRSTPSAAAAVTAGAGRVASDENSSNPSASAGLPRSNNESSLSDWSAGSSGHVAGVSSSNVDEGHSPSWT